MSIAVLEKQISRFLASETAEVMSIRGAWGVGKTYAWNKFLHSAKMQHKIGLKKYSYVSLFGINSLQDLKFSIYENLIDARAIGVKPTIESFKSNMDELLKTLGRKSFPLFSGSASANHYHSLLASLSFLALEKTVICIDDFERKGNSIAAQDVLGLISQLKEQKKCKVVLILNDESLSAGSSNDYVKLREKVIDTELRFSPTSQDCVAIALHKGAVARELGTNVVKLGINNIRIIKKIEALAKQLLPVLKKYDGVVLSRALRSLTLLSWCYYGQSNSTPNYNFVVSRSGAFSCVDDGQAMSAQQQGWCAVLRNYDNYVIGDFDLQIARLVENGYVDEKTFLPEAEKLNGQLLAARSDNSFRQAWDKFNDSFATNDQEVVDCLASSFKSSAKYISPTNLDGTVRLLRYMGKDKMASKIIALYVEKRGDEAEVFNVDATALSGEIKDSEVVEKFKEKYEAVRARLTLSQACELLLVDGDNCPEEEAQLSRASIDEFVRLFKDLTGSKLSNYVDLCLKFNRLGGMTEQQRAISDKATAALKIIGAESKLNASRVGRFGIIVS